MVSKARKSRFQQSRDHIELSWHSAMPGRSADHRQPGIPVTVSPADRITAIAASRGQPRDNETQGENDMTDTIPLVIAALELEQPVGTLIARIGDHVTTDEAGVRVIPSALCRQLIAQREAASQTDFNALCDAEVFTGAHRTRRNR